MILKTFSLRIITVIASIALVFATVFPFAAFAGSPAIMVTPAIISAEMKARDFHTKKIAVKNVTNKNITLFVFVDDIDMETGYKEFESEYASEKGTRLSNWIRMKRTLELDPGEVREVTVDVKVNPHTKPGSYHAQIAFGTGSSRDSARKKINDNPKVMLNYDVVDGGVIEAEIHRFSTAKKLFAQFPVTFNYNINSIGNRPVEPEGVLHVYNGNGEEVAYISLPSSTIESATTKEFDVSWDGGEKGIFGRYKAFLEIEYEYEAGKYNKIQDTTFFWVLPMQKVILIIVAAIVGIVGLVYTIRLFRGERPEYEYEEYEEYDDDDEYEYVEEDE